jgi:hypothetical protein
MMGGSGRIAELPPHSTRRFRDLCMSALPLQCGNCGMQFSQRDADGRIREQCPICRATLGSVNVQADAFHSVPSAPAPTKMKLLGVCLMLSAVVASPMILWRMVLIAERVATDRPFSIFFAAWTLFYFIVFVAGFVAGVLMLQPKAS